MSTRTIPFPTGEYTAAEFRIRREAAEKEQAVLEEHFAVSTLTGIMRRRAERYSRLLDEVRYVLSSTKMADDKDVRAALYQCIDIADSRDDDQPVDEAAEMERIEEKARFSDFLADTQAGFFGYHE